MNIVMQDGRPFLDVGKRSVKAYRKVGTGAGNWELKFAGNIWSLEDSGDGDTVSTMVTCYNPLKFLEKRVCRNHNGTYWPEQVRFWNSAVYEDAAGTNEDGGDGAQIIRKLILRTKRWGGTFARPGDPIPKAEAAPIHIDLGGKWEETPGISMTLDQEYIMDAIQRITDTQTCDLWQKPLDVFNGVFLRLGARKRLGSAREDSVEFVYASTPYSAREYSRSKTLDDLANYVHFLGKTGKNPTYGLKENAKSQTDYVVLEAIETVPGVEAEEHLQFLAEMACALRKDPRDLVTIVPTPEESPVPWNDYWLGDTVMVAAASTPFPVTRQAVEGVQRIYGIQITVDDDFGEYVSQLIVSPQEGA